MLTKLAANIDLFPAGGKLEGKGPLGLEGTLTTSTSSIYAFVAIISDVVAIITIVAGIWFLFQLLTSGFAIMSAGGDKAKAAQAKSKITSAAIGLVVVVGGLFIFQLIGGLIGINIFDFESLLLSL